MHEHQNVCSDRVNAAFAAARADGAAAAGARAGDAPALRFIVSTMSAALSGALRVVHLSTTKSESAGRAFSECPLLDFLVGVSNGTPDLGLAQLMTASAVGVWEQEVQDFMPL
jgi:hypothetical protein